MLAPCQKQLGRHHHFSTPSSPFDPTDCPPATIPETIIPKTVVPGWQAFSCDTILAIGAAQCDQADGAPVAWLSLKLLRGYQFDSPTIILETSLLRVIVPEPPNQDMRCGQKVECMLLLLPLLMPITQTNARMYTQRKPC